MPSPDAPQAAFGSRAEHAAGPAEGALLKLTLTLATLYPSRVEAALRAIAEPRRRAILRLVGGREMTAGEIASHFEVTRPAISQHITVLKHAGLLSERREGTRRIYRLRPEGLEELRAFVDAMWNQRLQDLKRVAEVEERRRRDTSGSHRRR